MMLAFIRQHWLLPADHSHAPRLQLAFAAALFLLSGLIATCEF